MSWRIRSIVTPCNLQVSLGIPKLLAHSSASAATILSKQAIALKSAHPRLVRVIREYAYDSCFRIVTSVARLYGLPPPYVSPSSLFSSNTIFVLLVAFVGASFIRQETNTMNSTK